MEQVFGRRRPHQAHEGQMADKKNGTNGATGEKITKMEAVRRALKKMGREAKPADMQPYIKDTFGIEMTTDHISTYKGTILNKQAKKPAAAVTQAAPARKTQAPAPRTPAPTEAADSILLDDVLTVKALLDRVGADRLRKLIDGLAEQRA